MSAPPTPALSFPEEGGFASGRAWRAAGLRGRAWARLAPELESALPRWLARGGEEGVELGPGVARVGGLVVKRFPPPTVFGWLRVPRAARSAAGHFRCLPVPSPRPLVAAWSRPGGASLLVREFVPGRLLSEVPASEEAAERALAPFLALLLRARALHGDLHPRNLLWTGERWLLLDVDGLRHGLHLRARVLCALWARLLLHLGDEARVRELYRRSMEPLGETARVPWPAVVRRAEAMRRSRAWELPRAGEPRP